MSREFLNERRVALEAAFFAEQDARLLQRLKAADEAKTKKEALAAASGISDGAVLDELVALGIDGNTLAALSLAPLVAVAWADGEPDEKERGAVLSAAAKAGLGEGDVGRELLDRWLKTRPPPELFAAWKDYVRATAGLLDEGARRALRAELLDRARSVAEATGGTLGIGRVSPAEDAVLERLAKAFSA